ncbi:uncharacterized protein LOC126576709 [Anopheles aquasalis]|uniref:uncharacterized protein LOC126576709 n=1 Tax=Anopheles aquasalis TaxID=42839 RepID=UPI00215A1A30|nr:uncharacterized protein LOC126576709 [Anopheles aquasalis]
MDEDNAIVCTGLNSTCNLNLEAMRSMFFPTDCQDVLFDVRFRGTEYNCSEIFHYSITEMGSCFTANSIYDQWVFVTVETYNHPEVRDEPVEKRKCRFPEERMSPTMPYSFSQCFLYNRIQFELELCNCTIPTSPKEYAPFYCDFQGLLCINKVNGRQLTKQLHTFYKDRSCMQACESLETNVIGEFYRSAEGSKSPGKVVLEVINFPILRYQRRVIRNNLDFVVSLGGIGGLYFGVSLISLIEFLYSVFFKPFYLRVRLVQR